jgi:hypothetical protein
MFRQTMNKSNKLNVAPISTQLQDNMRNKKKKTQFFLLYPNFY